MADYEERSMEDLTEEPSQHRLDEMRGKGQVAMSKELTSAAVFVGCLFIIFGSAQAFSLQVQDFMKELFRTRLLTESDIKGSLAVTDIFRDCYKLAAAGCLPLFATALMAGIVSSIAQTQGLIFSAEAIKMDLNHINPISGMKKLFSLQSLFQGVKAVVKFSVIMAALYFAAGAEMQDLPSVAGKSVSEILGYVGSLTAKVFTAIAGVLAVIAVGDYGFQWWNFRKQAMMTKQEAKQEAKDREGDPQIRARIRSVQREMARKRMMKNVVKADVIVTNPTHIAVAIQYEQGWMAPRVVAKGGDYLAEKIRALAREHGIPIVENKPLARALYKSVKVGQLVPRSFYQAVAEILAYVYRIKPKKVIAEQGHDVP